MITGSLPSLFDINLWDCLSIKTTELHQWSHHIESKLVANLSSSFLDTNLRGPLLTRTTTQLNISLNSSDWHPSRNYLNETRRFRMPTSSRNACLNPVRTCACKSECKWSFRRNYVRALVRRRIFNIIYGPSHYRGVATKKRIFIKYMFAGMAKDIIQWAGLDSLDIINSHFDQVHIDITGMLARSHPSWHNRCRHHLRCFYWGMFFRFWRSMSISIHKLIGSKKTKLKAYHSSGIIEPAPFIPSFCRVPRGGRLRRKTPHSDSRTINYFGKRRLNFYSRAVLWNGFRCSSTLTAHQTRFFSSINTESAFVYSCSSTEQKPQWTRLNHPAASMQGPLSRHYSFQQRILLFDTTITEKGELVNLIPLVLAYLGVWTPASDFQPMADTVTIFFNISLRKLRLRPFELEIQGRTLAKKHPLYICQSISPPIYYSKNLLSYC